MRFLHWELLLFPDEILLWCFRFCLQFSLLASVQPIFLRLQMSRKHLSFQVELLHPAFQQGKIFGNSELIPMLWASSITLSIGARSIAVLTAITLTEFAIPSLIVIDPPVPPPFGDQIVPPVFTVIGSFEIIYPGEYPLLIAGIYKWFERWSRLSLIWVTWLSPYLNVVWDLIRSLPWFHRSLDS